MTRNEATQRQIEAAHPGQSTWLSANAGSGKTRVLTDRVARLLLDGVEPQNILCLTYTKAAAGEMQNRLFRRLGTWAMMPDDRLRKDLDDLGVEFRPDGQRLRHARTLFAKAIETPGGLKIQTIHSFCASILRRFPLEAGISPQFREMEERDADLLQMAVLDAMADGPDAPLIAGIARHISEATLGQLIKGILRRRDGFDGPFDRAGLMAAFGLSPNARRDDAIAIAMIGGEAGLAKDIAECAAGASPSYKKFAVDLAALPLSKPDWATLESLFGLLLYADKTSKSRNYPQSNHTAAVVAFEPVAEDLHAFMDRTAQAWQFLQSIAAFERTVRLHDFARGFLARYDAAKLRRGVLDFDDLIRKAQVLLNDPGLSPWVLFKLDGGIDHVLVDEAQDTAPAQWDVITALTAEFSAGAGARGGRSRSVFVVGDKKQSIYSFQGADPDDYDRMRSHFQAEADKVGKHLLSTALSYSFRSSSAILSAVDQVFTGPFRDGLDLEVHHSAFLSDLPGRVDLWPVIEQVKEDTSARDWKDPVDAPSARDHETRLAERIAAQIAQMCKSESLPYMDRATGAVLRRRITEGDFLILVRKRKRLFSEILRACKARGLRVAGADKLRLLDELAVRDILALLRFLALAEDDLSLATVLRSPLFGWSEQALFTLAASRAKGVYLWQNLRASVDPAHADTLDILNDLRGKADFLRPYDLIQRILIRHHGRMRLLSRLGDEAEEGIDGLLSLALGYERENVPGLTGFLHWIDGEDIHIKRQMDAAGDQIRVMTVHGSKGLEAPIVILPDTSKPGNSRIAPIVMAGEMPLWRTNADEAPEAISAAVAELTAAADRESRRLLYVAMTRAEKWLIVAAAGDVGENTGDSWFNMVQDALGHLGAVETPGPDGVSMLRHAALDWAAPELVAVAAVTKQAVTGPVFDMVGPVPPRIGPVSPSDLGGAKVLAAEADPALQDQALARGRLLHLLLEHLPRLPAPARADHGRQMVANGDGAGLVADRDQVLAEVLSLIDAPHLAHLWTPDALAEVDITAALGDLRLHGTIDRLIVRETHVLVVDFKSNRVVPDTPADVPEGILRQMGAYISALSDVYPGRKIEAAILWTATGDLMSVPNVIAAEALRRYPVP